MAEVARGELFLSFVERENGKVDPPIKWSGLSAGALLKAMN